jgi:DNA-binding GntR family transcriptional regulator
MADGTIRATANALMGKGTVSLKKYAYLEIKTKIVNCIYAPGSILNENALASDLSISRTPIREALNQLHRDGLIRILPKKGILVSDITITDLSQIYQVRLEMEPFVARIAGPYLNGQDLLHFRELFMKQSENDNSQQLEADTAFHGYLAKACNNKYISGLMDKVLNDNKRVMISTQNKVRIENSRDEHVKVIDLLLVGDYEAAGAALRNHIANCRDSAFHFFLNQTNP